LVLSKVRSQKAKAPVPLYDWLSLQFHSLIDHTAEKTTSRAGEYHYEIKASYCPARNRFCVTKFRSSSSRCEMWS
jgi:hypothetical protein